MRFSFSGEVCLCMCVLKDYHAGECKEQKLGNRFALPFAVSLGLCYVLGENMNVFYDFNF